MVVVSLGALVSHVQIRIGELAGLKLRLRFVLVGLQGARGAPRLVSRKSSRGEFTRGKWVNMIDQGPRSSWVKMDGAGPQRHT